MRRPPSGQDVPPGEHACLHTVLACVPRPRARHYQVLLRVRVPLACTVHVDRHVDRGRIASPVRMPGSPAALHATSRQPLHPRPSRSASLNQKTPVGLLLRFPFNKSPGAPRWFIERDGLASSEASPCVEPA